MAQAKEGDTVKIHYTGTLDDGTVFDTSENRQPLAIIIGKGRIIPALEDALVGMDAGESKTLKIAAVDAYGSYDEGLVKTVGRNVLADGLEPEVGQRLKGTRMDGQTFGVTVTDVSDKSVTLDANHPLAGEDLTFDIQLVGVV